MQPLGLVHLLPGAARRVLSLPDDDRLVVSARSQQVAQFWMGPRYFPHWTAMAYQIRFVSRLQFNSYRLFSIQLYYEHHTRCSTIDRSLDGSQFSNNRTQIVHMVSSFHSLYKSIHLDIYNYSINSKSITVLETNEPINYNNNNTNLVSLDTKYLDSPITRTCCYLFTIIVKLCIMNSILVSRVKIS